ncbi:MAG: sugar-binding protein [Ancrocorticia sp.]|nr:sugar-binding protein [Ancrocorticia sp.]MCI1932493.1 sugar-binding protein [Ancrocorticia sp.]
MKFTRKAIAGISALALMTGLAACGGSSRGTDAASGGTEASANASDTLIGISMPTKSLERWNKDGANLESQLEKLGYKVSLQYADNKPNQQVDQIQNMANDGAKVVIVGSIDGTAVGPAVEAAKSNGATIIAYDRLIMNTDAVDYYATFDLAEVGKLQGQYIADALGLEDGATGPFNIELMTGSPDDNNARYFFEGAWSILGPYFESGVLQSPSGKVPSSVDDWQSIGILSWDQKKAQDEMENRLNSFYTGDTKLDAVLAPNDALALGTVNAIEAKGWDYMPVITGQDCDKANVANIVAGKQSMDVFKDTRKLADAVATMTDQIVKGETVETDSSYNNGTKDVPTKLLTPITITKDNVQEELVDTGYISAEDAGL